MKGVEHVTGARFLLTEYLNCWREFEPFERLERLYSLVSELALPVYAFRFWAASESLVGPLKEPFHLLSRELLTMFIERNFTALEKH